MQFHEYKNVIIDTSALMAFFYKETGWEIVAKCISRAVISSVNLSEAIKILLEHENLAVHESMEYINKLLEYIIPFDEEQACIAGELSLIGREFGLSLGDRACIAAGINSGLPIITADEIWEKINFKDAHVILIR